jgi:ferrous-iron efflux pump FieF
MTDLAHTSPNTLARLATYASVAVAFVLLAAKGWSYLHSGSVAMLSSVADSALDLLASGLNFLAVRYAMIPADEQHTFGHAKAEPLSALAQAAFMAGSGVLVIVQAVSRFHTDAVVENVTDGVVVMVLSIVLTALLVTFQRYVVRRTDSMAIGADAMHYAGDLLMNVSVIAALLLSSRFGVPWADPVFAIAISVFVIANAFLIVRRAIDSLMDRELPHGDRERILAIARQHPKVRHVHELRTRASGSQKFVQMHLVMDHGLSLLEAHRISDDVEKAIEAVYPGTDIIIHEDPDDVAEFHPPVGDPLH